MTTNSSEVVKFSIYAGSILANDGQGVNIGVEYVEKHDEIYDIEFVKNDIALLKLNNPLPFNRNISRICLPKSYREMRQKIAFMAGFGGTTFLSETTIPFQDFNHCKIFNQKWNYTSRNYICSGAHKSGSTKGDSGGPLMVQGSNDPRWFEVGAIVSSVYPDNSHGDWSHMVSTRISSYCDWIEEKTDGDAECIDMDDNNEIFTKSKYINDGNNMFTKRPRKELAPKDLYCTASCTKYFACIANGERYCTYAKGECNCDYPGYKINANCATGCTNYWYCCLKEGYDLCEYPKKCDCPTFKPDKIFFEIR